jgi:hypothetical protein
MAPKCREMMRIRLSCFRSSFRDRPYSFGLRRFYEPIWAPSKSCGVVNSAITKIDVRH